MCLSAGAADIRAWIAMAKLPEVDGVHPAGAPDPDGVMIAVTPCGIAHGDAFTVATRVRIASLKYMMMVLYVQLDGTYNELSSKQGRR